MSHPPPPQQQQQQRPPPSSPYSTGNNNHTEDMMTILSAVPTLRVMRLQKPELHTTQAISSSSSSLPSLLYSVPSITTGTNTNTNATTVTTTASSPGPLYMMESNPSVLQSALCLPDSLTVYVGETFTAYLGVLNTPSIPPSTSSQIQQYPTIRRLSVVAQLQTPSQRYPLPNRLDPQQSHSTLDTTNTNIGNSTGSHTLTGNIDIPPFCGVDAIVSRPMEEPGPHILRVEVGYYSPPDLLHYQTFRKFYRFQVQLPILVTELYTVRNHDTSCYTCIQMEYPRSENTNHDKHDHESLVLSNVQFVTPDGLMATRVTTDSQKQPQETNGLLLATAVDLLDQSQIMLPGSKVSHLFHIQTNTPASTLRGIAMGDVLGHVSWQWYKAMGEHGTIQSPPSSSSSLTIHCPAAGTTQYDATARTNTSMTNTAAVPTKTLPTSPFVMYRSGLSVDVAASAAATTNTGTMSLDQQQHHNHNSNNNDDTVLQLITVEPVDPPLQMQLYVPVTVPLLVVNHSRQPCTVQVQFNIPTHCCNNASNENSSDIKNENANPNGIVISGTTYQNIGTIPSHGGSTVTNFTFLPLQTGLCSIQYCSIMDVTSSGRTVLQPPLWMTYVVDGVTSPHQ